MKILPGIRLRCLLLPGFSALAISNGLARTPLMGFATWNWFGGETDCSAQPYRCMNEQNIRGIVDALVSTGLRDAGYTIVHVSESWPARNRTANGSLIADPTRFPSGMLSLSQYITSHGLRTGIYLDCGAATCMGYPGSAGHEAEDLATLVAWNTSYVWMDGCNLAVSDMWDKYSAWGALFNASGIAWEASWPAYDPDVDINYVASLAQEWRYYRDITADWNVIMDIVDTTVARGMQVYARPGQWNLPDMMEVGNPPLTLAENRAHFSLWAMLASPLYLGNDVRNMSADVLDIVLNREVIAIDQDPLGAQGTRVARVNTSTPLEPSTNCSTWNETTDGYYETCQGPSGNLYCFTGYTLQQAQAWCCANPACAGFSYLPSDASGCFKADMGCPFVPDPGYSGYGKPGFQPPAFGDVYARTLADASRAVLLLNRGPLGGPAMTICANLTTLGLNPYVPTRLRDVWRHTDLPPVTGSVCASVAPHDVAMFRMQQ